MRGLLLMLAVACMVSGCERTMKDMYVQPRLGADSASPLFPDGKGSRPPPSARSPTALTTRKGRIGDPRRHAASATA